MSKLLKKQALKHEQAKFFCETKYRGEELLCRRIRHHVLLDTIILVLVQSATL